MATGKRYYWIKLRDSFMSSDTVDYLMSQPNGANYVVLYQMLCLKTINTEGRLSRRIGEIIIPYDAEKIQRDCKWFTIDTIRVALELYRSFGFIYEDKDGTLVLSDHSNLVGSETDYAAQKKNQRQVHILPPSVDIVHANVHEVSTPMSSTCPSNVHQNVHIENRDKILDIRDKEIRDKSLDAMSAPQSDSPKTEDVENFDFDKIADMFNEICVSLTPVRNVSNDSKQAILDTLKTHAVEDFRKCFELAEDSSFLTGVNGDKNRRWRASFNWLVQAANMNKVLEGRYNDRPKKNTEASNDESSFDVDEFYEKAMLRTYGSVPKGVFD